MSDSTLRYTDFATAIHLAKATGMTTIEIVRALSGGMTYSDALNKVAKQAAPLLEISVPEFMRLRKNDPN